MRKRVSHAQWTTIWDHYSEYSSLSPHGSAIIRPRGVTKVVRVSNWDSAYLDFAMATYEGQWDALDGNHFPEIYSIHFEDDGGSIIVVERLVELMDLGYEGIDDLFGAYWNSSLYDLEEQIEEYLEPVEQALLTDSFCMAYDVMLDEARDRGWRADIHGYNIMVRVTPARDPLTGRYQEAKDELVIIDPWC